MNSRSGNARIYNGGDERGPSGPRSGLVFGCFWVLLFVFTFLVAGPWAGFHGILLGGVGILMLACPPTVALPRSWWILAAVFVVAGSAVFLPAGWFAIPEWREKLNGLGVGTGWLVAIQSRQAAEGLALLGITLLIGLWLAGHRPSSSQARALALTFTVGVAVYAVISKVLQFSAETGDERVFGFFPNRNHTATYLAMGAICGLGSLFQALLDRRFGAMAVAFVATTVCFWAVAGWSVSRGGVVLVAIGCALWLPMVGKRYLGKHGLWTLALIGLSVAGIFFITESPVKDRISQTVEKAGTVLDASQTPGPPGAKPSSESVAELDFRIPTALDTLGLIWNYKWTGIGTEQYYYVFPQYEKLTAGANDSDNYHPESDWLWVASEAGIPATLALAGLLVLALWKVLPAVLRGRERALRSACLVAAILLPIHGIFDVPGHRITLSLGAAFLFSLAMRAPLAIQVATVPKAWPFRVAALCLLIPAYFLIRAEWGGGPQPALTAGTHALAKAEQLYNEDRALKQAAEAQGQPYQPKSAEDRLEKALVILEQARLVAPLDRDILQYQAFIAFHFDDKHELIDRIYAVDRALDPKWVGAPIRQAEAWAKVDPERAKLLAEEALIRADLVDRDHPGSPWSRQRTLARIQQLPSIGSQFEISPSKNK